MDSLDQSDSQAVFFNTILRRPDELEATKRAETALTSDLIPVLRRLCDKVGTVVEKQSALENSICDINDRINILESNR
ncbi:hypothetical protein O181_020494 [Austropuccinia psidii MF-1]|uniref:Uncharacterized protein n=1 Tax=Austropuccinia psidii MF-1 TaxID=1389203 RepID=A0A9Q3C916_9BASI|nr:hypothetical protein [Austropuccinia psidii MF-1]